MGKRGQTKRIRMVGRTIHFMPKQLAYVESVCPRGAAEWIREAVQEKIDRDIESRKRGGNDDGTG